MVGSHLLCSQQPKHCRALSRWSIRRPYQPIGLGLHSDIRSWCCCDLWRPHRNLMNQVQNSNGLKPQESLCTMEISWRISACGMDYTFKAIPRGNKSFPCTPNCKYLTSVWCTTPLTQWMIKSMCRYRACCSLLQWQKSCLKLLKITCLKALVGKAPPSLSPMHQMSLKSFFIKIFLNVQGSFLAIPVSVMTCCTLQLNILSLEMDL